MESTDGITVSGPWWKERLPAATNEETCGELNDEASDVDEVGLRALESVRAPKERPKDAAPLSERADFGTAALMTLQKSE